MTTPMPTASLGWSSRVAVNGTDLSADALERLSEVTVEQHLHLPDVCVLHMKDIGDPVLATKAIFFRLLDQDTFPIGGELVVDLGREGDAVAVFSGEITALELEVGQAFTTIRAYARSHRLHRGRQSRTFLNMTDSDIVSLLGISEGGQMKPGRGSRRDVGG